MVKNSILFDLFHSDKEVCYLAYEAFRKDETVTIVQEGDLSNMNNYDTLICPCFTSFGFSQGFVEMVFK